MRAMQHTAATGTTYVLPHRSPGLPVPTPLGLTASPLGPVAVPAGKFSHTVLSDISVPPPPSASATMGTGEVLVRNLRLARPVQSQQVLSSATRLQLLVVDEDEPVRCAICEIAASMGFKVHFAASAHEATEMMAKHTLDLILMDLRVSDGGLGLLERLRKSLPRVPVVVMTAFATVQSAVEALRLGATDYLTKPFALEELTTTLEQAAEQRNFDLESRRLQEMLRGDAVASGLLGESAAIQKLLRMASKVASASHPVLITGESGSGKETLARSIHRVGKQDESFSVMECAAVSPVLMESELFGYVRHENSASRDERRGLLTVEGGGTLLLDQVTALPLELQAKLLRALQDRSVRPAGGAVALPITVRVIASTSRDVSALVDGGAFRRDLYLRLAVVHLRMPSLRERREDIPLLALHFLKRQSGERGISFYFVDDAVRVLCAYDWPGNVRELEMVIERACAVASGPALNVVDLTTQLQQQVHAETAASQSVLFDARLLASAMPLPLSGDGPIQTIADVEREAILNTLEKLNGDKLMAARLLGIGKTTLYRKLKEYDIDDGSPAPL